MKIFNDANVNCVVLCFLQKKPPVEMLTERDACIPSPIAVGGITTPYRLHMGSGAAQHQTTTSTRNGVTLFRKVSCHGYHAGVGSSKYIKRPCISEITSD